MVTISRNLKRFIYLISPSKIYPNFYIDLEKVLVSKRVSFFQLRLKNKTKNNIVKIFINKDEQKKEISEYLSQQKILIFTNNPVGTAKVCKKFEKDLKKLSAEVAFFDNQLYTKDDIAKVATLPSLDEIRGKIVGLINAPASKIARILQRPDQDIISILQNKKD